MRLRPPAHRHASSATLPPSHAPAQLPRHVPALQAALGGSPSRLGLVNAFLRVKERDRGALDFDAPGGLDTTWQRLYCCLRAGFHAEAVQVGGAVGWAVVGP